MASGVVHSKIPFRLIAYRGVRGTGRSSSVWVYDDCAEVTIVGNIAPTLKSAAGLHLSDAVYRRGFRLPERPPARSSSVTSPTKLGRKKLFS